jgi:hypothetical protein
MLRLLKGRGKRGYQPTHLESQTLSIPSQKNANAEVETKSLRCRCLTACAMCIVRAIRTFAFGVHPRPRGRRISAAIRSKACIHYTLLCWPRSTTNRTLRVPVRIIIGATLIALPQILVAQRIDGWAWGPAAGTPCRDVRVVCMLCSITIRILISILRMFGKQSRGRRLARVLAAPGVVVSRVPVDRTVRGVLGNEIWTTTMTAYPEVVGNGSGSGLRHWTSMRESVLWERDDDEPIAEGLSCFGSDVFAGSVGAWLEDL